METAIALLLMVTLFGVMVTAGQIISYTIGLTNAAGAAAVSAAKAADGSGSTPSQAAVATVNEEQNSTAWTACPGSGSPTRPCVSVSSSSQSTGSGTTVTVENVVVYGTYAPIFTFFGTTVPITVQASAST